MSAPLSASAINSSLSSAAFLPISGLAPAPSPLVNFGPSCIFVSALECAKACRSVFATINSTPKTSSSIMRFTAFPPAPPTPITFITAPLEAPASNPMSISFPPTHHSSQNIIQKNL